MSISDTNNPHQQVTTVDIPKSLNQPRPEIENPGSPKSHGKSRKGFSFYAGSKI